MSIFTYGHRVRKVLFDGATANFKISEITMATVNLMDAKRCLSAQQYFYVEVVYKTFSSMKKTLSLNKNGFLGFSYNLMAHYDLIGPYYKFCGDKNMTLVALQEPDKLAYRRRAKKLLDMGLIFQEEWMALHQEFLDAFYDS